ncbi:MAG: nucleotidyltransferase family protein [Candidatus Altiarchaeota archaeon]|nr:nucleotidyltransferase family protein [Candidatus Altiarchaeota archaeon]
MEQTEDLAAEISRHHNEIKAYGVKKIGVFGSYARGQQKKRSDVDVLVEFRKGQKTFDNYMDLKILLEKKLKKKVDLVIKEALTPPLKKHILAEVKYAQKP